MPAPNFDKSASHEYVCGVPGVAFEQNGCYYNIRHEYVKPSGRRRAAQLVEAMPGLPTKAVVKTTKVGNPVPDTVVSVSQENDKALRAEFAAD